MMRFQMRGTHGCALQIVDIWSPEQACLIVKTILCEPRKDDKCQIRSFPVFVVSWKVSFWKSNIPADIDEEIQTAMEKVLWH